MNRVLHLVMGLVAVATLVALSPDAEAQECNDQCWAMTPRGVYCTGGGGCCVDYMRGWREGDWCDNYGGQGACCGCAGIETACFSAVECAGYCGGGGGEMYGQAPEESCESDDEGCRNSCG